MQRRFLSDYLFSKDYCSEELHRQMNQMFHYESAELSEIMAKILHPFQIKSRLKK